MISLWNSLTLYRSDPQEITSTDYAASSWQPDPFTMPPTLVLDVDEATRAMYQKHWRQIRTRFSRRNKIQDWYNFRVDTLNTEDLIRQIQRIFQDQSTVFRLNLSFGFILRNNETGQLQFYHASHNNSRLFEEPFLISNAQDLEKVYEQLQNLDILEWVRQKRPNSKWIVSWITNVCFYVTKLREHPIGRSSLLPSYILNNKAIVALNCDDRTGLPYIDLLWFFRCLAVHNGCHTKNLERDTKHYLERFCQTNPIEFAGVELEDLSVLEKLFEVNIAVYSLEPTRPEGEVADEEPEENHQPEIAARLIRRSHCRYPNTMYLNLYRDHFSYIKSLARYSKSYQCSRCGKYWKHACMMNRHELTCEAKVRYQFPGGTYKTPKTIFDLLEDEGITIPVHLRFFPYRATFDFECMFEKTRLPEDTGKLNWEAKHVPLSVSVCSNVPGFDRPKCFVSEGDPKLLVRNMVYYLVEVSQESYRLVKELFGDVFKAIEEKLSAVTPVEGEREEHQEEQESNEEEDSEYEQEDRGIDVMNSDDEDDEEIESENEEDRAFIDDKSENEEQDLGFYRALNQELGETQQYREIPKDQKKEKKREHPLVKLEAKLRDYLRELPVLGFNSGKYDLNAAK
ncbi:uncharacterized protein LOC116308570 [Actinia tenebrosa]|uniref:Uncharacterized protein LOC116308570 n=1 Tax=Actinia tenebrosa TaxID=6105 RepID=A0A6P8J5D8_ACTTE|nr:uncharacterized protein LOC116308570 [Actinia tenebrosa]